jgi:diguanylate cyclase (GGDEF)-like protein
MLQFLPRGFVLFVGVIDLDGFKQINDNFGHATGDRALIRVGEALRSVTRESDLAARTGGDEFLFASILDLGKAADVECFAQAFCERLIDGINSESGLKVWVDLSLGYAVAPADGTSVAQLLHLADARMYTQKAEHHRASEHGRLDAQASRR